MGLNKLSLVKGVRGKSGANGRCGAMTKDESKSIEEEEGKKVNDMGKLSGMVDR